MLRPGFWMGLLMLLVCIHTSASAEERIEIFFEGRLDREGVPQGWILKEKTGEAEFKILKEDGETIAYFKSVASSFSLEKPLRVDPNRYPYISWRWKVLRLPLGGDVRLKGKNDQAAQLLIAFEGRKIISYIWDTSAPEGSIYDESVGWPINLKIRTITVKSGGSEINHWVSFKRNIVEDYKNLFIETPRLIKGVRVQINSQNTGTIAETLFGRIVLLSTLQKTQWTRGTGVEGQP
ncbi:MAG: DUF3047 domain-containing protein [Thermodesulfobacteriota bacterium]